MLTPSSSISRSKDDLFRSMVRDDIRQLRNQRQLKDRSISVGAASWESPACLMSKFGIGTATSCADYFITGDGEGPFYLEQS
jgi:hypothetical protein